MLVVQILVVDAGTWRLPINNQAHPVYLNFQTDMPTSIPYARWDVDDQSVTGMLKDKVLTRFSAHMPGTRGIVQATPYKLSTWLAQHHVIVMCWKVSEMATHSLITQCLVRVGIQQDTMSYVSPFRDRGGAS